MQKGSNEIIDLINFILWNITFDDYHSHHSHESICIDGSKIGSNRGKDTVSFISPNVSNYKTV